MHKQRVAVVSGGNRGLGFEVCRQLAQRDITVVLGSRDIAKGEAAAATLREENLNVHSHHLDVTHAAGIHTLKAYVEREYGRCDILVNNAGIIGEHGKGDPALTSILHLDFDSIEKTFAVNVHGALLLSQALVPLMQEAGYGRVVNVSSGMGALTDMQMGWPAYRWSKVALNGLTALLAAELDGEHIKVNSVCPGWVRTEMGGPSATRTVEEGAAGIVWLATLPDDGPTAGFFRDRERIAW